MVCIAEFYTKYIPRNAVLLPADLNPDEDEIRTTNHSTTTRFPHNYVGTTFKPLPGIHEMAAKLRERREKLEAAQGGQGKSSSHS